MNVIRKLTFASVKRNKKRSIATVIAVILSTALICGTAGLCTSALRSFQDAAIYQLGDFHVTVENVKRDEASLITENAQVKDSFYTQSLGYGALEGSVNEGKPYVYVYALSSRALSGGWGVHLIEGRLPQNENELLISDHVRTNARVNLKVGDTLTLALGTRTSEDGYALTQDHPVNEEEPETLENTKDYTFTVVGVAERPDHAIEGFMAPGYTCFTCASDAALAAADPVNVSFTLKNARNYDAFSASLEQNLSSCGCVIVNKELLEYSGALSEQTTKFLLGVGAVVTLIIMVTSVFVIRNSFAISVSEKTKQYGILASVGATAGQIRKSVLFEGLLFGLVGIPLGVGSGILAIVILLKVVNALLSDIINGLAFHYWLPPVFALVSALLAAVTIFFSAYIPARRAGKIPPIEAVRGSREINIRSREVRVSRLTAKLFGMGGVIAAKNLKRSRKKYRTTVVSLVLSVAVFISLSSFVGYLKKSVSMKFEKTAYNMALDLPDTAQNAPAIYQTAVNALGITERAYYYRGAADCDLYAYGTPAFQREMEKDYNEVLGYYDFSEPGVLTREELRESYSRIVVTVAAYDQTYFAGYLKSLGSDADPDTAAVLCDVNGRIRVKAGGEIKLVFTSINDLENGAEPQKTEKTFTVSKVVTDKHPMGLEGYQTEGIMLFVSETAFGGETEKYVSVRPSSLYFHAEDPGAAEAQLQELIASDDRMAGAGVYNLQNDADQQNRVILIAEIFLYGFITVITLIGVTNIFNTITTNMNLRQKEFAMLKSVGMTKKEFNRMIRLESLMYGLKSLLIGVPLGILGGVAFYALFYDEFLIAYVFPTTAVLLSVAFVFIIVGLTMRYSMGKINKQNIIETIRSENV